MSPLSAQAVTDVPTEELLTQAERYRHLQLDTALLLAQEAAARPLPPGKAALRGHTNEVLGLTLLELGREDTARHYLREAEAAYARVGGRAAEGDRLRVATVKASVAGDDGRSMELALAWIDHCKQTGNDPRCLGEAYWNAGNALYYQEKYPEAMSYSDRAIELLAQQPDTLLYLRRLVSYANSQRMADLPFKAMRNFDTLRQLLQRIYAPVTAGILDLNEGLNWLEMDSLDQAEQLLLSGVERTQVTGDLITEALLFGNLGQIALLRGQHPEAIDYLRKELAAARPTGNPYFIYPFEEMLAESYAGNGQYDSAYALQRDAYLSYIDFVDQDYDQQISDLQVRYETKEKDSALALRDSQLSRQRIQLYGVAAGLGLALLVAGGFLVLSRRLRRRNNENLHLLDEQQRLIGQKETLIGEIHHRVKNNLQIIASLLKLQSRGLAPDDTRARLALRESQSRVQAMGLIHQRLYQTDTMTSVYMPDYLRELGDTLLEAYRLDERINIEYLIEAVHLDVDTAIPLGLIINELITNSLKYAFPAGRVGTIQLVLVATETDPDSLLLRVSDDGVGATATASNIRGTSFGSSLIELLTQQIQGTLQLPERRRGYATELTFLNTV